MINRIISIINNWRNPKGVIRFEDGGWTIEHIRFEGVGIETHDTFIVVNLLGEYGLQKPDIDIDIHSDNAKVRYCDFTVKDRNNDEE